MLTFHELTRKEVEIYITSRTTFAPYAEEWVQAVFAELAEAMDETRSMSYMKAAIRNILKREVRDIVEPARNSRFQLLSGFKPQEQESEEIETTIPDDSVDEKTPHEKLSHQELMAAINSELSKLDPEELVLIESFMCGLSLREIGLKHGMSKSTALRRINVILDTLRPRFLEFR